MRAIAILSSLLLGVACSDHPGSEGKATSPNDGGPQANGGRRSDTVGAFSASELVQFFGPNGEVTGELQMATDRLSYSTSFPLAGDFDGDGTDSIAVFDARTGQVFVRQDNAPGGAELAFVPLGAPIPKSLPVAGDFDGDGKDTVGLYVAETGEFRLRNSLTAGAADVTFAFGPTKVIPFAGDFDGDGKDTIGVYDPVTAEFSVRNENAAGPPDKVFRFGPTGGFPIVGDWNGDGVDTIGVFVVATGEVHLRNTLDEGPSDQHLTLPPVGWGRVPVAGHWKPAGAAWEGFALPTASPESQGFDPALLDAALVRAGQMPDAFSALVLRNGFLVREEYFHGAKRSHANNIKSVSKSVLSAITGIANDEKKIVMTDPVAKYLPGYFGAGVDPNKAQITLNHLITMTAGLQWSENDGPFFAQWFGSADWGRFAIDRDVVATPGAKFEYNTGLTHVMSAVLTKATGESTHSYARKVLFDPLGIRALRWDRAPEGTSFGGAEVYMVPRDLARFGELYRNRGTLDGKRLVETAWIDGTAKTLLPAASVDGQNGYGGWWWTRTFAGHAAYFAWGYGGQFIFVFPADQLVFVVTSRSDVDGTRSGQNADATFDIVTTGLLPALR